MDPDAQDARYEYEDRLKAENARLRREVAEKDAWVRGIEDGTVKHAIEAERDRLREALERIERGGYQGRGDSSLSPGGVTRFTYTKKGLRAIARDALKGTKWRPNGNSGGPR